MRHTRSSLLPAMFKTHSLLVISMLLSSVASWAESTVYLWCSVPDKRPPYQATLYYSEIFTYSADTDPDLVKPTLAFAKYVQTTFGTEPVAANCLRSGTLSAAQSGASFGPEKQRNPSSSRGH